MSTDVPVSAGDDKLVLSDQLGSEDANIERMLTVQALRPLITALPDRERLVLRLRFFENMSQTQIAEQIGVSQMHVSRILARSIAALREQLENGESAAA